MSDNLTWDWTTRGHDWGYPMTVDAHVYRTEDLFPLFKKLRYTNPNSLEVKLDQHRPERPLMHCHQSAVVVNNPANIVQTQHHNRHADQDARTINTHFLKGPRLDPDAVLGITRRGPHTEFPLRFTPD